MSEHSPEMVAEFCNRLTSAGVKAAPNAPLGVRTTYRVGGNADALVTVESLDDLEVVSQAWPSSDMGELMILGNGSNLLVSDHGYRGVAVQLGSSLAFESVEADEVRIGGASPLPGVARRIAAAGLSGFEWAVGVPGSMGGAVRMNAGGHGSDISASLISALVYNFAAPTERLRTIPARDLALGYRRSAIEATEVVIEARIGLQRGDVQAAKARLAEIVAWRRQHQPGGQNAGSVFSNPPGDHAARLIEACGLKGYRLGSAQVSAKHANFIQADSDGRANDVMELMALVRERVFRTTEVALHTEIRLVGFTDTGQLTPEA